MAVNQSVERIQQVRVDVAVTANHIQQSLGYIGIGNPDYCFLEVRGGSFRCETHAGEPAQNITY